MNRLRLTLAARLGLAVLVSIVASRAQAFEPRWRKDMRTMAGVLAEALPIVISDVAYEKPSLQKKLVKDLRKLSKTAKQVEAALSDQIDDPVIPHVTVKMSRNFDRAATLLERGEAGAARGLVRSATGYCISCHTRLPGGAASVAIEPRAPKGFVLGAADAAEFYAATRQFDKAIVSYEAVMKDRWLAATFPHRWALAAQKMLAIVVRVREQPRLALEILSSIRDEKATPTALYRDTLIWRGSVQEWLAETSAKPRDLARASELFAEGEALVLKTGSETAGLIPFLRASAILHELLRERRNDQEFATTLDLAGRTAEWLAPIVLWTLNESYFEACIRIVPHTARAGVCLEHFKDSHVPSIERDEGRLSELERLASEVESGK